MKKIILIFLLLFSTKVKAETFYSDYSNFSEYSTGFVEKDEVTNVEEKENRKYYIEKKVESENGSFIDYENYETYSSGVIDYKPEEKEYRVITKHDNSYYLDVPKVRYVLITNTTDFRVESIPLYIKGVRTFYQFRCNDCFFGSYIHLSDTDYYKIDLGDYYDVKDIEIGFEFEGKDMEFGFTIEYLNDDFVFYRNVIKFDVLSSDISYYYSFDEKYLIKELLNKGNKDESSTQVYVEDIKYSYVDTIYKKYNLVKEYVDYETDKYDIEKLYRYQKRDKIEINDNIVLTSYKYNLNDFIKSTAEYSVIDNIDIRKNGNYSIIINFKGKEIKRNVTVKVKDNDIILDNENKLVELNNAMSKKEHELKTIIEEKEKVNEEVNTLNHVIANSKKSDNKIIINTKTNRRLLIIFLIIILLLLVLHIIRKKNI